MPSNTNGKWAWAMAARGGATVIASMALLCICVAPAWADSSSPLLAAYYDRQMAIIGGAVYVWKGTARPKRVPVKAVQVGVGRDTYYALNHAGVLLAFEDDPEHPETLMTGVTSFAAGGHALLAVKSDRTLWRIIRYTGDQSQIADGVSAAAVGDGANYYITLSGALFVRGKAHRGQYGNGQLQSSDNFVETASGVAQITAHTGHAILRLTNGDVMGTGGNIYGPVGNHGLGDKAVRWSRITTGARAVATGSTHTLAIRQDGTLLAWGNEYGPDPVPVMAGVTAAAAGASTTIAIRRDGTLWQWARGDKPRRLVLDGG